MSEKQTPTRSIAERPPSVANLFLDRVAATPDREAFRYPVPSAGDGPDDWRSYTWAQSAQRVYAIAAGLMDLGVRPEERVAIASTTRVDWILADLGIICAGAATTTVYPQTNAEETAYILADSGSRVLIAEDAAQLAKARERRAELPGLAHVVVIEAADAVPAEGDPEGWVLSLADLAERGAAHLEKNPDCVTDTVAALRPDQLATLIYTSGTTGRPKGVRLSQDTWSYMGLAIEAIDLERPDGVQYLWLPLAHVFGKVLLAAHVQIGHVMAVDGRIDKIIENLPVVRPSLMCGVPRIYERVYNGVAAKAKAGGALRFKIFNWAAGIAREYAQVSQENFRRTGKATVPAGLAARHRVADRLVYAKLRAAFGGRMQVCVSGSAALTPEIGYFFCGAGIPILEGYGLTESAAASFCNPRAAYRTGTVGKSLPGNEVKIADDGEILLRGPGIMQGYHGLPEQTEAVLGTDGWFHTGDIGELSDDGYLRITDRKKDLFKTSGGKYVAPTEIEGRFKAVCPYASTMIVIGAGRKYCSALIALDEAAILGWAEEAGIGGGYAEVVAHERTRQLIDGYVQELNGTLQRWQTVKKFQLLPRELDVEHGDLTPSLKLKRPVVEREFDGLIGSMYENA
ncbi:AMP-dependent synthetase/ligase [Streptomyces sp. MP131-18]|uniref:AMP-dependent synthetase/ligase n=1 Tax=Streptomyces sp. MP131-18 TaxID=1857892 RepID=UPI00097C56A2|nr:AMP-dependent synthetase/ligase [Streptomyces sp. MP131-18]ONK14427.1 Long-chain-fatty-acid--CoA ligase FadD15 [Streptomyces sp. MP131-18]